MTELHKQALCVAAKAIRDRDVACFEATKRFASVYMTVTGRDATVTLRMAWARRLGYNTGPLR